MTQTKLRLELNNDETFVDIILTYKVVRAPWDEEFPSLEYEDFVFELKFENEPEFKEYSEKEVIKLIGLDNLMYIYDNLDQH